MAWVGVDERRRRLALPAAIMVFVLLVVFLQQVAGYDALQASLATMPFSGPAAEPTGYQPAPS